LFVIREKLYAHPILAADITRGSVENIQGIVEGENIIFFTFGAISVL